MALTPMKIQSSTHELKTFIHSLGIDLVGFADQKSLSKIPLGLPIDPVMLFERYSNAIILGAQFGKYGIKASGDDVALHLENIAYQVMGYLEERKKQYLVIHPEDEYDPEKRMGLVSLKILAKEAGLGWQGRSLLVVSPEYGPIHRLIAILVNMRLSPDVPLVNQCGDCRICIDKCPVGALELCRFEDHPESRQEVLDIDTCLGDNGCTVCIKACPYLTRILHEN